MLISEITESSLDALLAGINGNKSDSDGKIELDEQRRSAILGYDDVQACPGSGKTTLVGLKLLLLLTDWNDPHTGICVLTHSNVAKTEILSRVGHHRAGSKLLAYPHFIGTIQDFVNTFFALPYTRSRGWDVHLYDENEYSDFVPLTGEWNFKVHDKEADKKYFFFYYFRNRKVAPSLFQFEHRDGKLQISSEFTDRVNQLINLSKTNLPENIFLKNRSVLCAKGVFTYAEMYELAKQAISSNPELLATLRSRFHVAILDEMQDTQRHQDELINLIFPKHVCIVQRFGDPDQSIFDSMGGGQPNTSYNDASLKVITESHRFVPAVASTLRGLSYRHVGPIAGLRVPILNCPSNTIFLFDDSTISRVLPAFSDLVLMLPPQHRSVVKAVGAIGKPASASGLTLPSYWPDFDSKARPTNLRAKSLCQAVKFCTQREEGDIAERYQVLVGAIVELMRKAGRQHQARSGKMLLFNRVMLSAYLRENDKVLAFGDFTAGLIAGTFPSEGLWTKKLNDLCSLLEMGTLTGTAADFAKYDPGKSNDGFTIGAQPKQNVYEGTFGVRVALSTIHSVKGETHDATLVCETKNYHWFDIHEMVEFMCNPDAARPVPESNAGSKKSMRAAFMKRLYVAMSRPRYLLCLAVQKNHLNIEQLDHLSSVGGWSIKDLTRELVS